MTSHTLADKNRSAYILLIEDNYGDVILTKRAFKNGKFNNIIMIAETGEDAIEILNKQGQWSEAPSPDLILLDINLPKMSGLEVLNIIKTTDHLKHIPVIMLSSSRTNPEINNSYNAGANGYIVKPVNLENFAESIKKLEQFWFTMAIMPEIGGDEGHE